MAADVTDWPRFDRFNEDVTFLILLALFDRPGKITGTTSKTIVCVIGGARILNVCRERAGIECRCGSLLRGIEISHPNKYIVVKDKPLSREKRSGAQKLLTKVLTKSQ